MMRFAWWAAVLLVLMGCTRTALRCDGTLQPINAGPHARFHSANSATVRDVAP